MLAMRGIEPRVRPELLDALTLAPRWFNQVYRDLYVNAAKHFPRFNGWLYDRTDVRGVPEHRGAASAIESRALRRFLRSPSVRQADLIVCTHFLCARVLSRLRGQGMLNAKLAVIVTDQHPHAVWRVPHADLFLVASESAADEMRRNHVDPRRVLVTGIPIDGRFDRAMSRAAARAKLMLPADAPLILLTGGGLGLGGIDSALAGILATRGDHFTVVVCGHNHELRARLLNRVGGGTASGRCRILGVTTKMHELMAAADLMVGKPGGLTTAEAAARGLPMVLLRPIPGQEERNAQVLVQANGAVRRDDPYDAGKTAATLVAQPDALRPLRHAARALGRPGAARAAARAAIELCSCRDSSSFRIDSARGNRAPAELVSQ